MTDSNSPRLVGIAVPTLRELRAGVLAAGESEQAVRALREAGYAGGDAVYAAFEHWLSESDQAGGVPISETSARSGAGELPIGDFVDSASRFFRNAGWGDMTFEPADSGDVVTLDIHNCWEANSGGMHVGGCHVTTGMLAGFFGRLACYSVAVMETECGGDGDTRCRFLMGKTDVVNYLWQEMR